MKRNFDVALFITAISKTDCEKVIYMYKLILSGHFRRRFDVKILLRFSTLFRRGIDVENFKFDVESMSIFRRFLFGAEKALLLLLVNHQFEETTLCNNLATRKHFKCSSC